MDPSHLSQWWHHTLRLPYRLAIRYERSVNVFAPTYILIHGLADTGDLWQHLLSQLPDNVNYLVVDLLGHGESPRPSRATVYSARQQARHLIAACRRRRMFGPLYLIGHSFGSLVAIEVAHRYPRRVKHLVLLSPPIYRDPTIGHWRRFQQETILRDLYRLLVKNQAAVIAGYAIGDKLRLLGFSHTMVSEDNYAAFVNTLEAGIINQTAARHLAQLAIPTDLIYGRLDPLLVPGNFRTLAKKNPAIVLHPLTTTHSVQSRTFKKILHLLEHPAP